MASFAEGEIEADVGRPELGAADDLEQVMVECIAGAKARLDIAVQEIDSRPIAQAQWLKDETDLAVNRKILVALRRSDIEVKGDYDPKIFQMTGRGCRCGCCSPATTPPSWRS
jgi:hypothetical protein